MTVARATVQEISMKMHNRHFYCSPGRSDRDGQGCGWAWWTRQAWRWPGTKRCPRCGRRRYVIENTPRVVESGV